MAISASGVYRLAAEELRGQCAERGLDSSGTVRTLRRRLADHIKSDQMEGPQDQPVVQASVPNDLESNGASSVSPTRLNVYRGGSADGQAIVLVELLRKVSPLHTEEQEDILRLFVRLGEVYDLGLVDDSTFIIRIMPLVFGSLLKFLGDCLHEGVSRAVHKSQLLNVYFLYFGRERLIHGLIVFNFQGEGQPLRRYIEQIFQAADFLRYEATEQ
jgi:hypothetical protein